MTAKAPLLGCITVAVRKSTAKLSLWYIYYVCIMNYSFVANYNMHGGLCRDNRNCCYMITVGEVYSHDRHDGEKVKIN